MLIEHRNKTRVIDDQTYQEVTNIHPNEVGASSGSSMTDAPRRHAAPPSAATEARARAVPSPGPGSGSHQTPKGKSKGARVQRAEDHPTSNIAYASHSTPPPPMPTNSSPNSDLFNPGLDLGDVSLPPGVSSLGMWGKTVIKFGNAPPKGHQGQRYVDVVRDQGNARYCTWIRSHRQQSGAHVNDFALYLDAYFHVRTKGSTLWIPGTSEVRELLDSDEELA